MDSDSMVSPTGLSKLTVPQLKAICKDRKLTGYSKLAKNALLEKLAEAGVVSALLQPGTATSTPSISAPVTSIVCAKNDSGICSRAESNGSVEPTSQDPGLAAGSSLQASEGLRNASQSQTIPQALKDTPEPALGPLLFTSTEPRSFTVHRISKSRQSLTRTPANSRPEHKSNSIIEASSKAPNETSICARSNLEPLTTIPRPNQLLSSEPERNKTHKRAGEIMEENTPTKQRKTVKSAPVPKSIAATKPPPLSFKTPFRTPRPQNQSQQTQLPCSPLVPCRGTLQNIPSSSSAIPNTVLKPSPGSGKRFKPLVINKKLTSSLAVKRTPPHVPTRPVIELSAPAALIYLDLPSTSPTPSLDNIALPPSIVQRKRVDQWAIILGELDDASRYQCVFVSKLFRYAVYLSAGHILQRDFGGKRLDTISQQYPPTMTNFWPYLRHRQQEATAIERAYTRSFLPRALKNQQKTISRRLWGSPDNTKQIVIAIRFLMTRLWFALSIGGEDSEGWLQETVVDVQEVIPGEIWSITLQDSKVHNQTLYILEATCEVVGHPPAPSRPAAVTVDKGLTLTLRADWSAYIHKHSAQVHLSESSAPSTLIMSHLKWANIEEYVYGISRLWLKRVAAKGELGKAKLVVARRYVLACVVGNSVSGSWKTATNMAQDFAGLSEHRSSRLPERDIPVNLYLPAHHHVESVHFATSRGTPLHPALAVVQTPEREYFILKDNGMQVGCEEDGVALVWMEVLQCDQTGCC